MHAYMDDDVDGDKDDDITILAHQFIAQYQRWTIFATVLSPFNRFSDLLHFDFSPINII